MVHVLQTKHNLVISRCCFAERTAKKCNKNYIARAQPLFCQLNLLFSDVIETDHRTYLLLVLDDVWPTKDHVTSSAYVLMASHAKSPKSACHRTEYRFYSTLFCYIISQLKLRKTFFDGNEKILKSLLKYYTTMSISNMQNILQFGNTLEGILML